ncbi:MAG: FAD-dependent oxidoreductase [Micavibrio sp.]|nr:FAD-dependent oxidoreductase [Micavibrio sp.]
MEAARVQRADIVFVGAGPVGLWTAIQAKKRNPQAQIQVYERYTEYQRSHVLRLEHFSMLLYGKKSKNPLEKRFYEEVTGKKLGTLSAAFSQAVGSVFIRTHDLEKALKSYAGALGINIAYEKIESPQDAMDLHPECRHFVAADGAHSNMRKMLLGENDKQEFPLQYVVEVKYQANGKAGQLDFSSENYKTNKLMQNMAFEYVGREKEGTTPVTLRFFTDKQTYDNLPQASFKQPLTLNDGRLPQRLSQDIQTYMSVRALKAGEEYREGSAKVSKLTLSLYAARKFAVNLLGKNKGQDRSWFFVGDAAMGVPYFRALNSGIIIGSQLGTILTRKWLSPKAKAMVFNAIRPLNIAWEFTAARGKNLGIKAYDKFRRASAEVPWEMVKWDDKEVQDFRALNHRAFRPGDEPQP